MQEVSAKRQTNIELLRIVSMLMIVFHHFAVHGGFEWEPSDVYTDDNGKEYRIGDNLIPDNKYDERVETLG